MKISALTGAFGLGLALVGAATSQAADVLVNGTLESSVSPAGWNLSSSITGIPGSSIPSLFEHNDGSNNPPAGGLGLLIKPQAGNQGLYEGMNHKTNFVLEQIRTNTQIAILPGVRTFTLTGETLWGGEVALADGYSGGVDLLHTGSPSDPTPENLTDAATVPSPTQTLVEVAFLNNSDVVVGTPAVLDLSTVRQNTSQWHQFSMPGIPTPVGATKVRIRVSATDMVDNYGYQNFLLDNLSLKDSVSPLERLTNGNLNTPGEPAGWTVTEGPQGTASPGGPLVTADTASFINFANHTAGGAQGYWIRPYVNTTQFDPDIPSVFATMTQTVPAEEGADYEFSAWTAWEWGFSAGLGPAFGSTVLMKMEFLNAVNSVIGTESIDLYTEGMRNDQDGPSNNIEPEDWRQFLVDGTAPAGTESVRVTIDAQGLFNSGTPNGEPQSAFFDDFSLIETLVSAGDGDHNGDGVVDAADYVAWRKIPTAFGNDPGGYDTWKQTFGQPSPGAGGGGAVPEPGAFCMLAIALGGFGLIRRRCA
jgi:hypothetical protein